MRPIALLLAAALAGATELPLIAHFPMDGAGDQAFRDSGGVGMPAQPGNGVGAAADGRHGGCWRFTGQGRVTIAREGDAAIYDLVGSPLTVALWVDAEAMPDEHAHTILLSKRIAGWQGYTFNLGYDHDGLAWLSAQNGRDTVNLQLGRIAAGTWTHLAFTHAPDGDLVAYHDGRECARTRLEGTLSNNDLPLLVGHSDDGSRPFIGRLDDLRLYAAALDPAAVARVMAGEDLPARPARREDIAPDQMPVALRLVRFDMALGSRNRDGGNPELTRMTCRRLDGPDAVDWPRMWIGGRELFAGDPEERVLSARRLHQHGGPIFQQPADPVVHPGNHWYRPLCWLWGHTFTYTTDSSVRGAGSELEIWTFPLLIKAAGPGGVATARLTCDGRVLYDHSWARPLDSLTLCLPQNRPGPAYELSVNGSPAVRFDAGLKPVTLGDPREEPVPVELALAGKPAVTVRNLEVPEIFPFAHDLKAQTAEMRERTGPWLAAAGAGIPPGGSFVRHLGIEVPRAPVQTYAENLTHGMSGGFWLDSVHGPRGQQDHGLLFPGDADAVASFLAGANIDVIIEQYKTSRERTPDQLAEACLHHGVRVGFNAISVNNANLAYYSTALPDFWLPKLRDIQLVAQHVRHYPNFAGLTIGADNGGYVPYWDWAPPIPNRPWGEAFLAINHVDGLGTKAEQPIGPALTPNHQKGYEVAGDEKGFLDYIHRYDTSFLQFGRFQDRVHEVDPAITLTTGSYGSGPGVLAQGGWPCGSVNGEPIFKGLDVLQSYDWDETDAEKPLHNLALMDRLRSWYPDKPAWMLLDDFFLKYGRQARQRVVALGLTRGLDMVGHNWLPQPTGEQASPESCRDETDMWAWVHRTSGAYAGTRPRVPIGILFSADQAISRPIADPHNLQQMQHGSQEGKAVEALLLCHLAGWPARLVTTAELQRGLPQDMQALLLVGLNRFDATWAWSDGLEAALQAFASAGGRLLLDDESVLPAGITGSATGMTVQATLPQGPAGPDGDKLALAISRNRANADLLRTAMADARPPLATTGQATVWAVPHRTGDVDYVTVTNWSTSAGKTAIRQYTPASAKLAWNSDRPIYDVGAAKRLTPAEAASCDLTSDAMRLYALPPGPVTAPTLALAIGADGFVTTTPVVQAGGKPIAGVPLELAISGPDGATATVWSASGRPTRLPIARGDSAGTYTVAVTELCAGQRGSASIAIDGKAPAATVAAVDRAALARFLARKDVPLVVALTKAQRGDPALAALGDRLVALCATAGRPARLKTVSSDDIIVGVQTYSAAQEHPKWQTIPSDLVLLGDLTSNVLLYDQALGGIFPPEAYHLAAGQPLVRVTCSPFVGNYNCLSLLGADAAALTAAVAAVEGR